MTITVKRQNRIVLGVRWTDAAGHPVSLVGDTVHCTARCGSTSVDFEIDPVNLAAGQFDLVIDDDIARGMRLGLWAFDLMRISGGGPQSTLTGYIDVLEGVTRAS